MKDDFKEEISNKIRETIINQASQTEQLGPMMTVSQRAKFVKQPRGGYIKRTEFNEIPLGLGEEELDENSNIHPILIGLSVDYLMRFMLTKKLKDAFFVSWVGANEIKKEKLAESLMKEITGLDNKSITNAIKLTGFDVVVRYGKQGYVPINRIKPNEASIKNVRIMVNRTINFSNIYGPITSFGFDFTNAYTRTVIAGDGDFLTEDTLWDLKVLKNYFNKNHSLQILMYWRMGLRSNYKIFKKIKYLGIYNPRKNMVYRYNLKNLSDDIINIVDKEVIGYDKPLDQVIKKLYWV